MPSFPVRQKVHLETKLRLTVRTRSSIAFRKKFFSKPFSVSRIGFWGLHLSRARMSYPYSALSIHKAACRKRHRCCVAALVRHFRIACSKHDSALISIARRAALESIKECLSVIVLSVRLSTFFHRFDTGWRNFLHLWLPYVIRS